ALGEILKTGPSRKIVECMKAFKEHFPDSDERLLYGTDWSMIAQEERFPKLFSSRPFPDVMVFFLRAVGYSDAQIEGIMFRNAVRFLGLGKAERNRARGWKNSMRPTSSPAIGWSFRLISALLLAPVVAAGLLVRNFAAPLSELQRRDYPSAGGRAMISSASGLRGLTACRGVLSGSCTMRVRNRSTP